MTLSKMMAIHDETALAALASLGGVRRAKRDFEAGKATVVSRDETKATVTADGKQVMIPASGLQAATCDCPATGICRHILLAVFALRESETAAPTSNQIAKDDLQAMTEADLRKFAGADWDKAINQARISTEAQVIADGANLSVKLPNVESPVVFLAGQGLAGAVFKGAKTAKRRVTTAAALVVRQQSGAQMLDQLTQDGAQSELITHAFLAKVQTAITALVADVFGNGAVAAEDLLFDLSISARAQSAPRLTSLLRTLIQQSGQHRAHHFDFREDRFLADAATAFAVAKALEHHPEDTQLSGILRRSYHHHDPFDLVLLGAVQWTSGSGARGLRIYGYAPQENAWFTTSQARGAGMDPAFAPHQAYRAALWGAGLAHKLIGTKVTISEAQVSADHQIAWDHGHARIGPPPDLAACGFSNWDAALTDIARRTPKGLRRMGAPVPVLLAPRAISDASFDDLNQCYRVQVSDDARATLELTIPATQHDAVAWVQENKGAAKAILCEATQVDLRQQLTMIGSLNDRGIDGYQVLNLSLDQPPRDKASLGVRALNFLKDRVMISGGTHSPIQTSPIDALCSATFDATAEVLRFGRSDAIPGLADWADAIQLAFLAQALRGLLDAPTVETALRVSYLAAEVAAGR